MLWVKAFHIIFMVAWMAGLLYLPRLFVYHAACDDEAGRQRFLTMERKLLYGIMHPALFFTLGTGIWMLWNYAWQAYEASYWLWLKMALVFSLIVYQFLCGRWLKAFKKGSNKHSHKFFRWVNEIPFLILIMITILVIIKPF